ncbi:hypothetical protein [Cupriavidus agavae]|uniref:hypothetical protein n=1 Tax=Cupriavidus agavae TaxID=1001822 RepID=UPI00102C5918|nr:hypothetical protein [Cupriavidus agavae]
MHDENAPLLARRSVPWRQRARGFNPISVAAHGAQVGSASLSFCVFVGMQVRLVIFRNVLKYSRLTADTSNFFAFDLRSSGRRAAQKKSGETEASPLFFHTAVTRVRA